MNSQERQGKLPPVPGWFEGQRTLLGVDVLVHSNHAHFGLQNQTVVLGRTGLLLLAPLPLREGSPVRVEVTRDGQRWDVEAEVTRALPGWGTVFRVASTDGWGWQRLKALLTDASTD